MCQAPASTKAPRPRRTASIPIKQEPQSTLDSSVYSFFPSFAPSPTPPPSPGRPRYTDEHQSTLDDARYTFQEACATAALVTKLGFLPASKKSHCRRNALRARGVLLRLLEMQAEWRDGQKSEVAEVVEKEVAGWLEAVRGCGAAAWDVDDWEWRRRAVAALEGLEGAVAGFGARGGGEEALAERVRRVVMGYIEAVHLVAMGWEGGAGAGAEVDGRVDAVYERMICMTEVVDVELVVREQAVMVASLVAGVSVMNT